MKFFVLCLALILSACATSLPPKPDYHHAPIEDINHEFE